MIRRVVYEKLAAKEALPPALPVRKFVTGEGFPYLGRSHRLQLVTDLDVPVKLDAGRFKMRRKETDPGQATDSSGGGSIARANHGLKVPFALDADLFRNDTSSPHAALREALVNTLIHADYEGRAGVRVLRDPSGYEFINPGLLLVTPEQVWRGGVSESRNPVLQRLFGLLQLGEREGSGGPAIRQAWAQHYSRMSDVTRGYPSRLFSRASTTNCNVAGSSATM